MISIDRVNRVITISYGHADEHALAVLKAYAGKFKNGSNSEDNITFMMIYGLIREIREEEEEEKQKKKMGRKVVFPFNVGLKMSGTLKIDMAKNANEVMKDIIDTIDLALKNTISALGIAVDDRAFRIKCITIPASAYDMHHAYMLDGDKLIVEVRPDPATPSGWTIIDNHITLIIDEILAEDR